MKKISLFGICFLMAAAVYAQQGFTGPGSTRQEQKVTVSEVKNLRDDTRVVLTGTLVQQLDKEHFTFRDETGEITVEIDRKIWRGVSVGTSDTVEISGKIEVERGQTSVEVKQIRKV